MLVKKFCEGCFFLLRKVRFDLIDFLPELGWDKLWTPIENKDWAILLAFAPGLASRDSFMWGAPEISVWYKPLVLRLQKDSVKEVYLRKFFCHMSSLIGATLYII